MKNSTDESSLNSVSGGIVLEAGREAVRKRIPEQAITAMERAQSNEDLDAILRQYNIDPAALAEEFSRPKQPSGHIAAAIPDSGLSAVSGGFTKDGEEMSCVCGAKDRSDFTYQPLATAVSAEHVFEVYSCDRCGRILQFNKNHSVNVYTLKRYPYMLLLNTTYMPKNPATVAIPQ